MDRSMQDRSVHQEPSRWFHRLAPMFALGCFGLALLIVATVIVLSLIPIFLQKMGGNIDLNTDAESGLITNSYSSSYSLQSSGSTTVTNTDDIARQLEKTLQLSSGSLRVNNVLFGNNGGRRKRQIPQCITLSSSNSIISFQIAIVYPTSCGRIRTCKQKFYSVVANTLASYASTFSITFKFSDGRSISIQLTPCNITSDTTSSTSTTVTSAANGGSPQSTLPSSGGTSGMSGYSMYPATSPASGKRRRRSVTQQTSMSYMPIGGILITSLDDGGAQLASELSSGSSFVKYLPMGVQHLEAVDGQHLDFYAFLRQGKLSKNAYTRLVTQNDIIGGHFLTAGAVGCVETHIRAWQRTAEIGMPMLILEDDVDVNVNVFDVVLPYLLYGLPTNFSILYFGNLVGDSIQASLVDHNELLWKMVGANWGTYAYLISPEAAASLLDSIYPIRVQVDSMIREIAQLESFDVFMSKQILIRTNNENGRPSLTQRYSIAPVIIPRIFHFIWLNKQSLSTAAQMNIQRWKELHPNWEIKIWTNESDITSSLYNKQYFIRSAHIPRQASDILRYEVVYRYGGIYVDIDFEPLKNIEPLLHGLQAFIVHESESFVCNGIFGAVPRHELTARLVSELGASWNAHENSTVNQRTGPYHMTRQVQAINANKKTSQHGFQIFAPHLFFPYAWYEQDSGHPYDPDAFAVHHFRSVAEINRNVADGQ